MYNTVVHMKKILIIEDDRKISDLVKIYLEEEGINALAAYDGPSGLQIARKENPDFIILDLGLPGMDGIEIAREIRKTSNVPILMLTARSEEFDKVLGLEIGADDYVTKPFSPKELVARIKAIFRRIGSGSDAFTSETISISNLVINPTKFQVMKGEELVKLSALEFKILSCLASNPGRVYSRTQLLTSIYEDDSEGVLDRTIDVHIKNIRKKLDDNPRQPTYIESVHGVGYRFLEPDET